MPEKSVCYQEVNGEKGKGRLVHVHQKITDREGGEGREGREGRGGEGRGEREGGREGGDNRKLGGGRESEGIQILLPWQDIEIEI